MLWRFQAAFWCVCLFGCVHASVWCLWDCFLCNPLVDYDLPDLDVWGGALATPPCACVCQSGCACMLMLACQSKPPLGSQSHQLLIKLVCRGSTSVLTDVTDAGKCISVCIGAAAVDFYAISAEWGAAVYRAVGICKVCVYVCLQSSTYSWCSFINHKSLTAKTAATSANCFCLPSDQLSSVLSLFYILSFSPFPSRTSPSFSLPALLSSQLTSFMVACLNWCFFSPLTSCASWHAWWFTNTHTQKAI